MTRAVVLVASFAVVAGAAACGGNSPTAPSGAEVPVLPPAAPAPSPTPIAPGIPQIFVGAGDIAMCDANAEHTARLLDRIGGVVFTLGDHAYFHGTAQQFRDCYEPTWGRHRHRTRPVPGNHDYETAGATAYFEYFGPNAGPPGLGYYSFPVGSWHAIALNSNIAIGARSAQAEWLRRDLQANPAVCTVAYFHHPLFTSGPDGPSTAMRDIWQILYDAGVDMILNGHEHFYERFAPQDPNGVRDPARGIRQFIAGTGGAILYQAGAVQANSEMRLSAFGVLKLTLAAASYDWEFVPVSGPSDLGTELCH
jgi:hypothetical protein